MGTIREDDDASTDEQEELGWIPGEVGDRQAFAAERTDRVSKGTRKKVQHNPPSLPQRVKVLPSNRETQRLNRQMGPIEKNPNRDSNHTGPAKRITPIDINQDKFEGKVDGQFLPMQIDQDFVSNLPNNLGKEATSHQDAKTTKVTNPGPNKARDSTILAQNILNAPLTMTVQEAVRISPNLRRDLVSAVKSRHEDQAQTEEKTSLVGVIAATGDGDEQHPSSEETDDQIIQLPEPREDLLRVPIKVGKAKMVGVFDTGSQINIMSQNLVEQTGLPWIKDKNMRSRVIGVDGKITRCIGKLPRARILVSENQYQTFGEFHVLPNPDVVLLGRLWGTGNGVGLSEKTNGTHLSFVSGRHRYQINACPIKDKSGKPMEQDNSVYLVGEDNTLQRVYTARTNNPGISDLEVPDSDEEERHSSDSGHSTKVPKLQREKAKNQDSPNTIGEDPPTPTSPQSQGTDGRKDYIQDIGDKEPGEISEEDEDIRIQDTKKRKRKAKFEIDSKLHETFIKMVQKGISNDEWNAFCRAETRSRRRDGDLWKKWSKSSEDDEDQCENSPTGIQSTAPSPEPIPKPSQTLREPKLDVQSNQSDANSSDHESNIVASSRSRRTRRKTERALGEEYQRFLKSYQRKERIRQKNVRSNGAPITDSDMYAFSAQLGPEITEYTYTRDWEDYGFDTIPAGNEDIPYYEDYSDDETDVNDTEPTTEEATNEDNIKCNEDTNTTEINRVARNNKRKSCWSDSDDEEISDLANNLDLIRTWQEEVTNQSDVDGMETNEVNVPDRTDANVANTPPDPDNPSPKPPAPYNNGNPLATVLDQTDTRISNDWRTESPNVDQTETLPISEIQQADNYLRMERMPRVRNTADPTMDEQSNNLPEKNIEPPDITIPPCESPLHSPLSTLCSTEYSPTSTRHASEGSMDEQEDREITITPASIAINRARSTNQVNIPQTQMDKGMHKEKKKDKELTMQGNEEEDESTPKPRAGGVRDRGNHAPEAGSTIMPPSERLRERVIIRDGVLEELDKESFYEDIEPSGMRHLPRPRHLPNGLLASINLIPFADDPQTGERYFEGLGSTLVTNDARGSPIKYHGDATIRLSQPPPGVIIEVPREERVNEMRERLFRMGPYARRKGRTRIQQSSASSDSGTDEKCACGMTAIELQEMMERIISKSFETHEEERTYEIHKTRTGVVVRQARNRPKNQEWEEDSSNELARNRNSRESRKLTKNGRASRHSMPTRNGIESGVNTHDLSTHAQRADSVEPKEAEDSSQTWEVNIARLVMDKGTNIPDNGSSGASDNETSVDGTEDGNGTERDDAEQTESKLGNNPHTSDQAPARESGERWRTLHRNPLEWENPLQTIVRPKEDPNERSTRSQHRREEEESIKEEEQTHRSSTHPCKSITRNSPTTSKPPGQSTHNQAHIPKITPLNRQLNPYPLQSELISSIQMSGQDKSSVPSNLFPEDVNPPGQLPPPSQQRPAVIYLDHFVPSPEQDTPRGVLYDGFGATVVNGGAGEVQYAQKDRARVLFSNLNTDVPDDRSRPPPENPDTPQYRSVVESSKENSDPNVPHCEDCNPRNVPPRDPRLTLNPKAPAFIPRSTTVHEVTGEDDDDDKTWTPMEMEEVIRKLRGLRDETKDSTADPNSNPLTDKVDPLIILVPDDAVPGGFRGDDLELINLPVPGSPPALKYPTVYELVLDEKAAEFPTFKVRSLAPDLPASFSEEAKPDASRPEGATDRDELQERLKAAFEHEVENLIGGDKLVMVEALAKMGILQIAWDMEQEMASGKVPEKTYWLPKIMNALEERLGGKACFSARTVSKDEMDEDPYKDMPPLRPASSSPDSSPDQKPAPLPMEPPYSPVDWYPGVAVPPYVPNSPVPGNQEPPYVPRSPESDPLDEIRLRTSKLEDRVEASHLDLKEKLREIESQMFADECLLTELKWKDTELKDMGGKVRADKKKNYRRNPQGPPGHRYPTRYSNGVANGKIAETKRDVGKMGDRIRRVEEKIEDAKREIRSVSEKITAGEALETQINELKDKIASQQEAQSDINSVLHTELADLKNTLAPAIDSHVKPQRADIATLQQQVQYLYGYAASLFAQPQSTYVKNLSTFTYPTPANSPSSKLLTAY